MSHRRALRVVGLAAVLAAVAVALVGAVDPTGSSADRGSGPLEAVRNATRRYRDVGAAVDAGNAQFFGCVHEPLAGSMGVHFVNGTLAGDTVIDRSKPEALTYEVGPDGELTLAGVEYVVSEDWNPAVLCPGAEGHVH